MDSGLAPKRARPGMTVRPGQRSPSTSARDDRCSARAPGRAAQRPLPHLPLRLRDLEMARGVEARAVPADVVGPPAEEQSGVAALDVALVVAGVAAGGGESVA